MPVKINYNGNDIASVDGGKKATLNCKGKLMEDNVLVDASGINEKDSDTLLGLLERTITEIEDDRVTVVAAYAFYSNKVIQSISFPNATSMGFYACFGASNLTHANLPKAATVGSFGFADANLYYFDAPTKQIYQHTFRNNANLSRLILRNPNKICTLDDVNAFSGTPFASGGTGGTVYVPSSLIESYQTATNWASLNCEFKAIEDYLYTFTIDGKTYLAEKLYDDVFYNTSETDWAGWVNSPFNIDGFKLGSGGMTVYNREDKQVSGVYSYFSILADDVYTTES